MNVDSLAVSLSPREIPLILQNLPMPSGVTFSDATLIEGGIEITVKANAFLGLPVKVKVEVQGFSGSRIRLKITPPIKSSMYTVIRPVIVRSSGLKYAGYSSVEMDLIDLSRGTLLGVTVDRLEVNRTGLYLRLTNIRAKPAWGDLIQQAPGPR